MGYTDTIKAGLGWRFGVTLDGLESDLLFSGCSGLDASYEELDWKEGGNNAAVLHLPGPLTYTNVKLTRTVDKHSKTLRDWFTGQAVTPLRHDAVITLYDGNGQPVTTWTLSNAYPVKYAGPNLSVTGEGSEQVATESLELSHQGFGS